MSEILPSYSNPDPSAIAILGISLSGPGGGIRGLNIEALDGWNVLSGPPNRQNAESHRGVALPHRYNTKDKMTPEFVFRYLKEFGISPMESAQISPAEVVLFYQVLSALQRSGIDYRGTATGVYVGYTRGDAAERTDSAQAGVYRMMGTTLSAVSKRISDIFDLLGPTLAVDTTLSVTALHLAIQALKDGKCDQAVVADINFTNRGFASAVVIKRHDLAVKDMDNILATLFGTLSTSLGIMTLLTSLSQDAHAQAVRSANPGIRFKPQQVHLAEVRGAGMVSGHFMKHERRPQGPDAQSLKHGPFLFAIGALSPNAVRTLEKGYKDQRAEYSSLALCAHLGSRARQMPWRSYAIADRLQNAAFPDPVLVGKRPNPLVFCFAGQGPHHWHQGRDFMTSYSVFRESVYACDRAYSAYTGRSFLKETGLFVADPPASSPLADSSTWPVYIISVSMTFFQIAMFDLLTSLGIKPNAMVGPSVGVTAAMYANGSMPREMVIEIAVARGRALDIVDNTGNAMVVVCGCDTDTVRRYVDAAASLAKLSKEEASKFYLAAPLSATDNVFSAPEVLIDLFTKYVDTCVKGVITRKLPITTGVHSPLVDPCEESYRSELAEIFSRFAGPFVPSIPTMSMVTGGFQTGEYTMEYLWDNLKKPILFASAIVHLVDKFGERTTFVEVSPHPVHSLFIKKSGAFDSLGTATRIPTERHPLLPDSICHKETHAFLQTMGQLLLYGVNSINFAILNGCPSERVEGPAYPLQVKIEPAAVREVARL